MTDPALSSGSDSAGGGNSGFLLAPDLSFVMAPDGFRVAAPFSPRSVACWGDSMTAGVYPTLLADLLPGRIVYNRGVGGETSAQILERLRANRGHQVSAAVIWAGTNDETTLPYTAGRIADMVERVAGGRYLVLSISNRSTEIVGTPRHTAVVAFNAALETTYGERFIDIRKIIVDAFDPLQPQDVLDHANDIPPASLRDGTTHYNAAGYQIVADQVAAKAHLLL